MSRNWVAEHVRIIGLQALSTLRESAVESDDLGSVPAEIVERALASPRFLQSVLAVRDSQSYESLSRFSHSFRLEIRGVQPRHQGHPVVLGAVSELPGFLAGQDSRVIRNVEQVLSSWNSGIEVLHHVNPQVAHRVQFAAFLIAGLEGPFGEIAGFSSPHFPGCLSFGVNNPPALIAEEILHEAVHLELWSLLALDPFSASSIVNTPSIYSPFTGTIRPAVRVLHGLVSYSAVNRFWERLLTVNPPGFWFGPGTDVHTVVIKRLDTLKHRLRAAVQSLEPVTRLLPPECLGAMFALGDVDWDGLLSPRIPDQDLEERIQKLDPIARAEYHLALAGKKVSRLSVTLAEASGLAKSISSVATAIGSDFALRPEADQRLGGFSNTVAATTELLLAKGDDSMYLYVASDADSALAAWRKDRSNDSGGLFGIPDCCQAHFAQTWHSSRQLRRGDLFEYLLDNGSASEPISIEWACNAAAMYFGDGLCWHFPCSRDCPSTVTLIKQRYLDLLNQNPALAKSLIAGIDIPFLWSRSLGYGRCLSHVGKKLQMIDQIGQVQWLQGADDHLEHSFLAWVEERQDDERRLVLPTRIPRDTWYLGVQT